MERTYHEGQKVTIYLNNDDRYFKGNFVSMNTDHTVISINNITRYPDLYHSPQPNDFFIGEIKSVEFEDPETGLEANLEPNSSRILSYHKQLPHAHLSKLNSSSKPTVDHDSRKTHKEYPKYQKLFENFIIVDKIDQKFHNLITDFKSATEISVGLEGERIGRFGKLFWLNVSSQHVTVLFDILSLGKAAFENGLRDLLQSNDVTKVIHDSRMAADCLYYQYKTQLINVIDTQVFDMMVMRTSTGKIPTYVTSLNNCLQHYLNVPKDLLIFPMIRDNFSRLDAKKWSVRPLGKNEETLAVQNVAFLLDLKVAQKKAMLDAVRQATQIFSGHVVNMSNEDANKYYGNIHMTPRQLFGMGKHPREQEQCRKLNLQNDRDAMQNDFYLRFKPINVERSDVNRVISPEIPTAQLVTISDNFHRFNPINIERSDVDRLTSPKVPIAQLATQNNNFPRFNPINVERSDMNRVTTPEVPIDRLVTIYDNFHRFNPINVERSDMNHVTSPEIPTAQLISIDD